jgi:hypothetical protein
MPALSILTSHMYTSDVPSFGRMFHAGFGCCWCCTHDIVVLKSYSVPSRPIVVSACVVHLSTWISLLTSMPPLSSPLVLVASEIDAASALKVLKAGKIALEIVNPGQGQVRLSLRPEGMRMQLCWVSSNGLSQRQSSPFASSPLTRV